MSGSTFRCWSFLHISIPQHASTISWWILNFEHCLALWAARLPSALLCSSHPIPACSSVHPHTSLPRPHADKHVRTYNTCSNIQHMHSNTVITHMLYSHIPPSTCPRNNNRFSPYVSPHPDIPQTDNTPHIPPCVLTLPQVDDTLYTETNGRHPSPQLLLIVLPSPYRPPPFLPRPSIRMK